MISDILDIEINQFFKDEKVFNFINTVTMPDAFYECSGSAKPEHHHYGTGGLDRHTREVFNLCVINGMQFEGIEMDVLLVAAIFHDWGKMWDYKKVGYKNGEIVWGGAPHKRNIHHISRSAIEFNILARQHNLDEGFIDKVTHCILSHHGQREYGSPVSPKSREAWLLHLCDSISARMDDTDKRDLF